MRVLFGETGFKLTVRNASTRNLEALIHRVSAKPFTLEEICTVVEEELQA